MLIDEMCNRENTKRDGPSVVARLMGMDTLPKETGPTIRAKECFSENLRQSTPNMLHCESNEVYLCSLPSTAKKSPLNCKQQNSIPSSKSLSSTKPHQREHPQEEQLQKFKKEFEAWQESKLWEFSSNPGRCSSEDLKKEQIIASENLNKGKMAVYMKNPVEIDDYVSMNKGKITQINLHGLQHDGNFGKQLMNRIEDDMAIRRELEDNSFESASSAKFQEKRNPPCSPTRIVILKPSSDMSDGAEEPWGSSPEVVEKCSSMEDFLEEVKERLRLEMEGKGRIDSVRRGNSTHTSLHERSTDPKQLARDIAKHIRESVTRDLGSTSVRSESTRSFRNDSHVNEQESHDSIKKDARKFISDRLKNVLKDDTEFEKPMFNDGRAENSSLIKGKERSKSMTDFSKEGKGASFWEDKKAVNESIPKYLRREQMKMADFDADAMSPPNLIRSFSAPASGTAFGKLLLEDHRAQLSRKHETSKNDLAVINRNKKDGFDFKGRVSILRRNLSFKGKIFGKKMSSIGESTSETFSYMKSIETMPSVIRNFGMVEDNSTEVPPSPVSFYSSPTDEHHSPVSPLEVPSVEDHTSTQVSDELGTTLHDSGIQPQQIESKASQEVATEAQLNDTNEIMQIEHQTKSYIRDILIVSGLYKAWPLDQTLSRLDGQTVSISSSVFDEMEEKYCTSEKVEANCCKLEDIDMDRKLLFDLANEALPAVIGSLMSPLTSKRWKENVTQLPCGIKLLDGLFHQIKFYANPKVVQHQSIEKVVAWDLKLRPWFNSSYEDVSFVEKEIEGLIIEELIDELVSDL